ncbi:MAG: PcfB family protein [Eubacteriales bacterium]
MQDEIDQKTIAFSVNTTKFTGRTLLKIAQYLTNKAKNLEREMKNPTVKHGKQSVKRLGQQNQGMTSVEVTDENIKCFEKYAKKYGVDFALKKDGNLEPPKFMVFFKARDDEAIQNALKDFSKDMMSKTKKPSVIEKLRTIKDDLKKDIVAKQLTKTIDKNLKRSGIGR